MSYTIAHDKRDLSSIYRLLTKFPDDWQRDKVAMAIFRRASKPANAIGRAALHASTSKGRWSTAEFKSKADKTKTIMRAGLVNKKQGRLGHLFNFGTGERVQYTTGKRTGKITGNGWWDRTIPAQHASIMAEMDKVAPRIISRYVRKYKQ